MASLRGSEQVRQRQREQAGNPGALARRSTAAEDLGHHAANRRAGLGGLGADSGRKVLQGLSTVGRGALGVGRGALAAVTRRSGLALKPGGPEAGRGPGPGPGAAQPAAAQLSGGGRRTRSAAAGVGAGTGALRCVGIRRSARRRCAAVPSARSAVAASSGLHAPTACRRPALPPHAHAARARRHVRRGTDLAAGRGRVARSGGPGANENDAS